MVKASRIASQPGQLAKKTHTYSKKSLGENSESIENGKSTTKSTHAFFELEC